MYVSTTLRSTAFSITCLALASCGALGGGRAPDPAAVGATIAPALACDNAERCARGMETDLLPDVRLSDADRAAVAATIRSLRAEQTATAAISRSSDADPDESHRCAEALNRRTDAALAQWSELNARYRRRVSE